MASFRKHENGWEFRIRYRDPTTQKFKEKSKRGFSTKKEAKIAATEEERKIQQGYEQEDISLVNYLEEWLNEYKKDTVRKNTLEIHQLNIKNHILPYFNSIQLRDLKPFMYQKFLNQLSEKGYSKRTIEIVHGTMYNALSKAVILGKIEKNPSAGATIKGKKKKKAIEFIESDKIHDFLEAAYQYDYIYWLFYKVLIYTGIRKGEAAALQWTDIDFKNKIIDINKSLDFKVASNDKNTMFGDVKTYGSKRTISISQSLANDLHFHVKYQNQNKIALNAIYHHDLNLVLCRNDGNYMPKSSLFNSFSRILKRAEIDPLPIHSLRHTHAVLLLEAGADMKYVQERLGHGSIQVTSDVYAHISKKIEQDTMGKFEDHMKRVLE
jgi:integrase